MRYHGQPKYSPKTYWNSLWYDPSACQDESTTVMREMRSWSQLLRWTTESLFSLRSERMPSSFSACGTVRGSHQTRILLTRGVGQTFKYQERKNNGQESSRRAEALINEKQSLTSSYKLIIFSWSLIHSNHNVRPLPDTGIHDFLRLNSKRSFLRNMLRNMSPVARWHMQYLSRISEPVSPFTSTKARQNTRIWLYAHLPPVAPHTKSVGSCMGGVVGYFRDQDFLLSF